MQMKVTILSLKRGFLLSPHTILEIQKKRSVMKGSKLSLSLLNIAKTVSKSDFNISKQISPVTVKSTSIRFVINLRFARETKLILSKYVNIMRTSEENAVFTILFSRDEKGTGFQKRMLKVIQLLRLFQSICLF